MAPIRYSLHYEDYAEHLMSRFGKLLQSQSLVDMTLMCSSHTLRVHKAVLSASSAYFQEVLQKQTGEPLIILKMRFSVLKSLVEFMYCGKTQCLEENMDELVSAAQFLKIKGLSKVTKEGLGISSTSEVPVFTPPVVINRPPQSLIDFHAQDSGELKSQPPQTSAFPPLDNRNKELGVRNLFDESGPAGGPVDFADPARFGRPRRGRPSFRRPNTWEGGSDFGRATERALLRREQDSRKAIHQLKNLQTRHMQDYMDRVTLSQAVNSICDPESQKQNYMSDNDLIYMDQNMPSDVLNPNFAKEHTLSTETITSSSANDSSNGGISNAMSQYVNALKNAGLPTDLPILFESGDGSYINVNEQVLLDMVQSSEIQYEVIEQPNIMEKVSDPSEIKSIDDLSKSIERGEMLMSSKSFHNPDNFDKDSAHEDAINSLNEILPDNLDTFGEQQNFVVLDHGLTNNSGSIDPDNTHDFSCIDSDMQFFTKSMSDDVKKYYQEPQLSDDRGIEQFCPTSTALDTSFNMSLLDAKSSHLNDPIADAYSTLNPSDLGRNDDCFDFESQLPNTNDFKDETLDYLISTSKEDNCERSYDEEKQAQERDEIIKDLMKIESKIKMKDPNIDDIQTITDDRTDKLDDSLDKSIISEPSSLMCDINDEKMNIDSSSLNPKEINIEIDEEFITEGGDCSNNERNSKLEKSSIPELLDIKDTSEQRTVKDDTKKKTSVVDMGKEYSNEKSESDSTPKESIPFAVGLLPLKRVHHTPEDGARKRKNHDPDFMDNVDAKCLKRKMKYKKI